MLVCTTTSSVSRDGEAEGGKERRLEHLPFSNELTRCNTCVESSPSNGREEGSKRRDRRSGGGGELRAHREIQKKRVDCSCG